METVDWEIVTYEPGVDNSGKEPGFEYIPQNVALRLLQRDIFAGKVASIKPYLVPATPA